MVILSILANIALCFCLLGALPCLAQTEPGAAGAGSFKADDMHDNFSLSSPDLLALATRYAGQNRLSEAIAMFREVLRREPNNVSAHNNLAVCLKSQGQTKQALEEFKQAIANNPTRPELYNNLALSYMALGQYTEAEEALFSALRLGPDLADSHRNLGLCMSHQGQSLCAGRAYRHRRRAQGAETL